LCLGNKENDRSSEPPFPGDEDEFPSEVIAGNGTEREREREREGRVTIVCGIASRLQGAEGADGVGNLKGRVRGAD